jgi:diaminopimelate decarboxylase
MEQIASAIASIVKTAKLINEAVRGPVPADATPAQRREVNQIKTIDIGGGLCTNFDSEANTPSFADWRKVLEEQCPDLFTGEFHVITELGRRLLAKQGVLVSKIEYVKQCGGRRVVLQHAGADVCVRTVYKPDSWPLRATAFAAAGNALHPVPEAYGKGELLYADIAGPCCIDDVLAPQLRPLPEVAQNDYIMLHDTGAYYHSAFSYYNMRMFPALYAFYEPEHWHTDATKLEETNVDGKDVPASNGEVKFELIRPTASLEDVMEFFVTKPPKGN